MLNNSSLQCRKQRRRLWCLGGIKRVNFLYLFRQQDIAMEMYFGLDTVVAICITTTFSYISGEMHVRLWHKYVRQTIQPKLKRGIMFLCLSIHGLCCTVLDFVIFASPSTTSSGCLFVCLLQINITLLAAAEYTKAVSLSRQSLMLLRMALPTKGMVGRAKVTFTY